MIQVTKIGCITSIDIPQMPVSSPVEAFAYEMEERLEQHNEDKGVEGWRDADAARLSRTLKYKAHELNFLLDYTDSYLLDEEYIRELCADIGNYAMMVADNAGALRGYRNHNGN